MSDAVPPALARTEASVAEQTGTVTVTFVTNGMKTVSAAENSNLLRISLREQGGIPFKCGGGLCGTCRCRIESGLAHTDAVKPKERRHLTDADLADGYRMACQTFVKGDISVSWVPRDAASSTVPRT
jgi:ferredoxin